MATWIAHLRIAENILNRGYDFEPKAFLAGNIGPDSGVPSDDWRSFTPPKKVTHWLDENKKIDAIKFLNMYLNSKDKEESYDSFSFKTGYYTHLLTDMEWSKLIEKKKKDDLYKEWTEKNPDFIWTIKRDWYGLDYLYLSKHPECIFYTLFINIKKVPDYLDYFPQGAFENQVKRITDFYLGENEETKENFIYLTEKEMDDFVINASGVIDTQLKKLLSGKAIENIIF